MNDAEVAAQEELLRRYMNPRLQELQEQRERADREALRARLDQYVWAVMATRGLTDYTDIVQRAYTQMQTVDRFIKEHA